MPDHPIALRALPRQLFCVDDNYRDQPGPRRAGLALHQPDVVCPYLTGAAIEDVLITTADPLALQRSGADVIRPRGCERLDVGVSLVAVVSDGDPPGIAGYAVALDFMRCDVPGHQAYLARSFPTHKVISDVVVDAEEIPSIAGLIITLHVNGEVRQRSSTSQMIAGPAELVATISARCDLYPGDLVLTGSPAGRPRDDDGPWLRPGSRIEGAVEGVGRVSCAIVDEAQVA